MHLTQQKNAISYTMFRVNLAGSYISWLFWIKLNFSNLLNHAPIGEAVAFSSFHIFDIVEKSQFNSAALEH